MPKQKDPPSGICYDFVRGQCPRGKKCRFSHDLREIAIATSRSSLSELKNNDEDNEKEVKEEIVEEEEHLKSHFGSDLISAVWLSSSSESKVSVKKKLNAPEIHNDTCDHHHHHHHHVISQHESVSECNSDVDLKFEIENVPFGNEVSVQHQMSYLNEDLIGARGGGVGGNGTQTKPFPLINYELMSMKSDSLIQLK